MLLLPRKSPLGRGGNPLDHLCRRSQARWTCPRPRAFSHTCASCGRSCSPSWSGSRGSRTGGSRISSPSAALELVEATERELAGQGQGQPVLEGQGAGASALVSSPPQLQGISARAHDPLSGCVRALAAHARG
jgi:hypothetical protein